MYLWLLIFTLAIQSPISCITAYKYDFNPEAFFTTVDVDTKNKTVLDFMTAENLEKVYGAEALNQAAVYDSAKQTYLSKPPSFNDRDINFILYTSESATPVGKVFFLDDPGSLERAGFLKNTKTKIICHGFMSSYRDGPGKILVPAYLGGSPDQKLPLNVILVDWSSLAGIHKAPAPPSSNRNYFNLLYFPPVENTVNVGAEIAKAVRFLIEHGSITLDDIHLIGHSLGAQTMGYAAKDIQNDLKDKVARVTGLDPAGPCYETWHPVCFTIHLIPDPIDRTDANFVDIIHTNSRLFGMKTKVGQADFYPNGGAIQPDCGFLLDSCSHSRSIELFAKSVCDGNTAEDLLAHKCASWELLLANNCGDTESEYFGEYCSTKATGFYYLEVNKPELCNGLP